MESTATNKNREANNLNPQDGITKCMDSWPGKVIHRFNETSSQLVLAPYSIAIGLFNFLCTTSDQNQQRDIKQVMGLNDFTNEQITTWFQNFHSKKKLSTMANFILFSTPLKASFYEKLTGTGTSILNKTVDVKSMAADINDKVSKATTGDINEVVQPNELTNNIVTQINVISLNQLWKEPFKKTTDDVEFNVSESTTKKVTMMEKIDEVPYFQGKDYEAIALPLIKETGKVIIVLPTKIDDFSMFEDPKFLINLNEKLNEKKNIKKVNIKIPIWKINSNINLKGIYNELGNYFNQPNLNEALKAPPTNAEITKFNHIASIEASPQGIKASAATVSIWTERGIGSSDAKFECNRPFEAIIQDHGNTQFCAKVNFESKQVQSYILPKVSFQQNHFFFTLVKMNNHDNELQSLFKETPSVTKFARFEKCVTYKKQYYYTERMIMKEACSQFENLIGKEVNDMLTVLNNLYTNDVETKNTYFKIALADIDEDEFTPRNLVEKSIKKMTEIPIKEVQSYLSELSKEDLVKLIKIIYNDVAPFELIIARLRTLKKLPSEKGIYEKEAPHFIFLRGNITNDDIDQVFEATDADKSAQIVLFLATSIDIKYPKEKLGKNKAIFSSSNLDAFTNLFLDIDLVNFFNRNVDKVAACPTYEVLKKKIMNHNTKDFFKNEEENEYQPVQSLNDYLLQLETIKHNSSPKTEYYKKVLEEMKNIAKSELTESSNKIDMNIEKLKKINDLIENTLTYGENDIKKNESNTSYIKEVKGYLDFLQAEQKDIKFILNTEKNNFIKLEIKHIVADHLMKKHVLLIENDDN